MNKRLILAFFGVCVSWSFSWFAIKHQSNSHVSVYSSLAYRFFASGIICLIIAKLLKYNINIKFSNIKYISISAATNASLNFVCGYTASKYISSGMIAAIFSLSIVTNEIFLAIADKRNISKNTIISSLIGITGLILFILPTIHFSLDVNHTIKGVYFAVIMPIIVCFGYQAMKKCIKQTQMPLLVYISYTFILGGVFSLIIAKILHHKLSFDFGTEYILSLLYLIIFASCVAYISLYYLIQKLGAAKANYTSLIYTVGAILVSTYFEDYQWHLINIVGFFMIILSLFNEFRKK